MNATCEITASMCKSLGGVKQKKSVEIFHKNALNFQKLPLKDKSKRSSSYLICLFIFCFIFLSFIFLPSPPSQLPSLWQSINKLTLSGE